MNKAAVNVPETPAAAAEFARPTTTRARTGKASRQRRTDNFRIKVGSKQLAERREEVSKRLGVFDQSCEELEKNLLALQISVLPRADPLPDATRGVGLCSVVEYSRMATTWNLAAIAEICTIYQYYRVELFLFYYKLFLARYDQGEAPSSDVAQPFMLAEDVRQVVSSVTQVPRSFYNILAALGKIECVFTWHTILYPDAINDGETAALYLYPTNIRNTLENVSDPAFDVEARNLFHQFNPLPGANWQN